MCALPAPTVSSTFVSSQNLHKGCEASGSTPVTFRVPRILSTPPGKVVISERCNPRDEAEFAGLVHFMPTHEVPSAFQRLCTNPGWRTPAQAAHRRFRETFAPRVLFERAGIYDELERLRRGLSGAGSSRKSVELEGRARATAGTSRSANAEKAEVHFGSTEVESHSY